MTSKTSKTTTTSASSKKAKASAASLVSNRKELSRVLLKKLEKAQATAQKDAGKTQVRLSRRIRRLEKQAAVEPQKKGSKKSSKKKAVSVSGKLELTQAQAPASARISAPRGPIQPVASRTTFVERGSASRKWLVVDAANQTVGRLSTEVAMLLRGKHKPSFTPNNDAGDFVVVINASKALFTSDKESKKTYYSYSGWIGGMKQFSPQDVRKKFPERIIFRAVRGMVPRSPLGRKQMSKLKIYAGSEHPHSAQQPVAWSLKS
jgi:large subunit ribosomal protein L13